jgi:hypothetical protein
MGIAMILAACMFLAGPLVSGTGDVPDVPGAHDVWELSGTDRTVRWLVIHNLAEGVTSGVFHVEVLERKRTDPAWHFTHLAPHMAITAAALRASVLKPLKSGRVYPEQFEDAFAQWRKQQVAGTATTCERSVLDCLKGK